MNRMDIYVGARRSGKTATLIKKSAETGAYIVAPSRCVQRMRLNRKDVRRLHECLTCPFFEKCEIEVAKPEDYPDGQCKTKDMFNEKLVNETCTMYENAAKKMLMAARTSKH